MHFLCRNSILFWSKYCVVKKFPYYSNTHPCTIQPTEHPSITATTSLAPNTTRAQTRNTTGATLLAAPSSTTQAAEAKRIGVEADLAAAISAIAALGLTDVVVAAEGIEAILGSAIILRSTDRIKDTCLSR